MEKECIKDKTCLTTVKITADFYFYNSQKLDKVNAGMSVPDQRSGNAVT